MRPRFVLSVTLATVVAALAIHAGIKWIDRDRHNSFSIRGTRSQFGVAQFWLVNETGRRIRIKAFANGRELFEREVPDLRPTPSAVRTKADDLLRFPVTGIQVSGYDLLNRDLELQEVLSHGRKQSVRVKGYPERPDDFWIRVTAKGFKVEYAGAFLSD